jgi:hypothetical protein
MASSLTDYGFSPELQKTLGLSQCRSLLAVIQQSSLLQSMLTSTRQALLATRTR